MNKATDNSNKTQQTDGKAAVPKETKDSDRERDRRLAEACFAMAGQDPHAKCPHGLTGYGCMDCNH